MFRFFFSASSAGGQHAADAGGVDGHRLLAEDVLAGVDGGLQVHAGGSAAARPGAPRRRRCRSASCRRRSRRSSGPASTATWSAYCFLQRCRGCLAGGRRRRRPWPPASQFGSAFRALAAAPVPRPPQPIRPILQHVAAGGVGGAADGQRAQGCPGRGKRGGSQEITTIGDGWHYVVSLCSTVGREW